MGFMTNWQSFCKETQNPHHPKSLVVPPFAEVSFLDQAVDVNFFFPHDQLRTKLLISIYITGLTFDLPT